MSLWWNLALQPLQHFLSGLVSNLSPKDGLFPMLDQNVLSSMCPLWVQSCVTRRLTKIQFDYRIQQANIRFNLLSD